MSSLFAQARPRGMQPDVIVVNDSAFEPISTADVKSHLRIRSADSSHDVKVTQLLSSVRKRIEKYSNTALIKQHFRQEQNYAEGYLKLLRTPVIGVSSFKYIADYDDDTQLTWPSANYIVSAREIVPRSVWPSHRGYKSLIVDFTVGYGTHPDSFDDDDVADARAMVPGFFIEAILQWLAHLFENRSGNLDVKYETIARNTGTMPQNVSALLENEIYKAP